MRLRADEILIMFENEERAREDLRVSRTPATGPTPAGRPIFGFASPIWDETMSPHPWLNALLDGAKSRAQADGCDLLLLMGRGKDAFVRRCRENGVGGVVYHAFRQDEPRIQALLDAGVPCVAVDADADGSAPKLGRISSDNAAATALAVRHLYALGRRRIAALTGSGGSGTSGEQRLLGYRQGLEAVGLPYRSEYVAEGDFLHRSGLAAMRRLLGLADPPDAVVSASDTMAIGAIAAIERAGLRVPEDVAVIGFDDIEQARLLSPQLTTLRQDVRALGVAAVEALVEMTSHPDREPPSVSFPCELIVRESCGAGHSRDSSAARVLAASGLAAAGVVPEAGAGRPPRSLA
jgi:LacI family transcriptional regulator